METFRTAYSFTPTGYMESWVFGGASALAFLVALITLFRLYRSGDLFEPLFVKKREHPLSFPIIMLLGSIISFAMFSDSKKEYEHHRRLFEDYEQNRYHITEGSVHLISQQPSGGRGPLERITVGGMPFTLSAFSHDPGYQTTISHGGILREGVYVRLYHKDGYILRIDMWGAPSPTLVPTVPPRPRQGAPWIWPAPTP